MLSAHQGPNQLRVRVSVGRVPSLHVLHIRDRVHRTPARGGGPAGAGDTEQVQHTRGNVQRRYATEGYKFITHSRHLTL
ncbi:hypothetical protein DPMN_102060 [Dreissena polymorpha]|uniref:Uncharacterized protein n=1 Tax=Dreissena polymorpha TaxID=45954 RepID=A0A9D4LK03_DREPO|nr:hypothetical protein DPMN_102060 [Dreissena polymorpha]